MSSFLIILLVSLYRSYLDEGKVMRVIRKMNELRAFILDRVILLTYSLIIPKLSSSQAMLLSIYNFRVFIPVQNPSKMK